jgi:hypothetical protein
MSGDNIDGAEWVERSQGLLTQTEREVLIGDEQFEPRGREARSRIRRRLGDALLDYIVLDEHLPAKDVRAVYAPSGDSADEARNKTERNLVAGLKAQVRHVYRAAKAAGLQPETLISDAVDEAKGTRIEELSRQFAAEPTSLSVAELGTLLEAGEISHDEYEAVFSETVRPPTPGRTSEDRLDDEA